MENTSNATHAASVPERLRKLLGKLGENLIERDIPLRLAILAALSGEHILLVGPPGTAKSALARRMRLAFTEGAYFERLLTRFTVPEELFGPLSIKKLEEDRYERLTEGYLPAASVAFLDEIFKANSAILNALLTLLNEREFDNGIRRVKVPLVTVVGASNELPEGEELNALFDRFMFRYHVAPVSSSSFPALLTLPQGEPTLDSEFRFSAEELRKIQREAEEVLLPDNVRRILEELRAWCKSENIAVSDRRWRKIVAMLKMSAFSNGRKEVSIWDAWLVQHCVWEEPKQREKIYGWYEERVGLGQKSDNQGLTRMIMVMEKNLKNDQAGVVQTRDDKGRLLFTSKNTGDKTTEPKEHSKSKFLAPKEAAYVRDQRRGFNRINTTADRSNNGKGYSKQVIKDMCGSNQYPLEDNWVTEYLQKPESRLIVENAPCMEPKSHKPIYVQSKVKEVGDAFDAVRQHRDFLSEQKEQLEEEIRGHFWVPDNFVGPAAVALDGALVDTDKLLARVDELRKGFEGLPLEKEFTAKDLENEQEESERQSEETDDSDQSSESW